MGKGDNNRNLVAALSYLLGFITGIVIFLVEKDDKFIRFHSIQSIAVFGGLFIINVLVSVILGQIAIFGVVITFVNILISVVAIIIWIVSMVKAYHGQMFKWPIAGDFAERQVR